MDMLCRVTCHLICCSYGYHNRWGIISFQIIHIGFTQSTCTYWAPVFMHTTCLGRGWILCECKTRKFRLLSQFLQVGPFKQITFHWVGTDRKGQRKGVNKSTELKDGRESTHFWVFQSTASDGKWKICEMNKTWNFQPISRSVLLIQYCPHLYWSSSPH